MLKIAHRVNTLRGLSDTPAHYGVEMDVHGFGPGLTVHHDALTQGEDFDAWLAACRNPFVIFNVKEEGVEGLVLEKALARGFRDFFLLDLSFPALMKLARRGERRLAVRVSEFEAVESALLLKGLADWVWLDLFGAFPLTASQWRDLKDAGFRVCLVSPELHGRSVDEIAEVKAVMAERGIDMDAVCTKRPDLW